MPKTSDNKDLDSLKNALKVPENHEKNKEKGFKAISDFQVLVNKFNDDPTIQKFIKKRISKTGSALKETQKALEKFNKIQCNHKAEREKLDSSYNTFFKELNNIVNKTKKGNSTINTLHDEFQKYIDNAIEIAGRRCLEIVDSVNLESAFEQVRQEIFNIPENDSYRESNINKIVASFIREMFDNDQAIIKFLKNNSSSELGKALLNLEEYVNTSIDFKELIAYLKEVGESSLKCKKRKGLRKVTVTLKSSPLNTKINDLILEIDKKKNH